MNTRQKTPFKRHVLEGLRAGAYLTGLCAIGPKSAGATVLAYHSVAPAETERFIDPRWRITPAAFERQMRFVARHCKVISLSRLVADLRSGKRPAPKTVVLTFDDGYLDNLQVVAPILARHNFPATLYVPTAYIDDVEPQWVDRLYSMFVMRSRQQLVVGSDRVDLADPGRRLAAYKIFCDRLRAASYQDRRVILKQVRDDLRPQGSLPQLTLDWEQVREFGRRYPLFEIAGHSVNHADLSACDNTQLRMEIEGCMANLQREIGLTPKHFSFPYGRATADGRQMVIDAGYDSAVSAGAYVLTNECSDRFAIARLEPPSSMTQFKFWCSGAYDALPARLVRN